MILKKPYAFLIKRFKLIHLIITAIMIYLALRINDLYVYFNTYSISTSDRVLASKFVTFLMFVSIFGIILFSIIVYLLMRFKKKPKLLYLITIIGSFVTFLLLMYNYSTLRELEFSTLDTRTIRLVRDLDLVMLIYQCVMIALMLIRGLGFDIKKFNFSRDLQELEIKEDDNEEFEFAVGVNTDEYLRKYRRTKREFKYVFLENKFIITIGGTFILTILVVWLGILIFVVNKVYSLGDTFRTSNLIINIKDSYTTNESYNNKNIMEDGSSLLILSTNLKSPYNYDVTLNKNKFRMVINGNEYYPTNKYCSELFDIGKCNDFQTIDSNGSDYILVYNIKGSDVDAKKQLVFVDSIIYKTSGLEAQYKKVNIKSTDITKETLMFSKKQGEELNFYSSFLKSNIINIESYSLSKIHTYKYNYCIENNCVELTGVVHTSNIGSVKKTILKLDMSLIGTDEFKITSPMILSSFGSLKYIISGKTYTVDTLIDRTPNNDVKNSVYVEVPEDVTKADTIWLEFKVRDKKYEYILK